VVPTSIGFHDAGVDSEAFAFDQAGRHASRNDTFKDVAKDITLPEPVQPVLREGRVVRDLVVEIKPAEPAIRQMQFNFLVSLRSDRRPKQYPTISIRIISSGSIDGRPISL
jgi:hypothetical protein